ncbi:MAG TPA: hypothetical protein IAA05_10380 [Candidatus Blautia excrementipullorum]|nr:hypothetical protein [Candidatus Blautia excrementipullorum]
MFTLFRKKIYLAKIESEVFFAYTKIDNLVVELVRRQLEKARQILKDNRKKLDELATYLYEKETITGEEFMSILNAGETSGQPS